MSILKGIKLKDDETVHQLDYETGVANKPKIITSYNDLTGKPFYTEQGEEVDLLPSQELTFNSDMQYVIEKTFSYEEGKTYKVEFDGTTYECACQELVDGDYVIYAIGNLVFLGMEDTGEPFVSFTNDSDNIFGIMIMDTTTLTHTVRIYQGGEVVHQLDSKYVDAYTKEEIDTMFNSLVNGDEVAY